MKNSDGFFPYTQETAESYNLLLPHFNGDSPYGERSMLGWRIEWVTRDMWGDSLISYSCYVQTAKPQLLWNILCGTFRINVGKVSILKADLASDVPLKAYLLMSACLADVTSATNTRNTIHTLPRLLGMSNRFGFLSIPRSTHVQFPE
jgi:hypothetical protein